MDVIDAIGALRRLWPTAAGIVLFVAVFGFPRQTEALVSNWVERRTAQITATMQKALDLSNVRPSSDRP